MTINWIQCTLTTRTSSVGSRTGKQKASFHWGEVVRSLTFRTETSLFSYQNLSNYDNKNSPFQPGLISYCSFVGEFSESNLGTHFWFLAALLKLSGQKQIIINVNMQQTRPGCVFEVMCEDWPVDRLLAQPRQTVNLQRELPCFGRTAWNRTEEPVDPEQKRSINLFHLEEICSLPNLKIPTWSKDCESEAVGTHSSVRWIRPDFTSVRENH